MTPSTLLAAVRHATVHIATTLRPGSYEIPGIFGVATRLRIPSEVAATIDVRVERDGPHLRTRLAKLSLAPAIRIANPRRALHPPKGVVRNIIDYVKDFLADLLADGAHLNPQTGELEISGVIDVLHLFHRPIPPEIHPRIDLDLDQLLLAGATAPTGPAPTVSAPSELPDAIVRALASFIGSATLRIELEADPIAIAAGPPILALSVPPVPVQLSIEARAALSADGKLHVEITGDAPAIQTGLATGTLRGVVDAMVDRAGALQLDATGQLRLAPRVKDLVIGEPSGTHLPIVVGPTGGQVDLELAAHVARGAWRATVQTELAVGAQLSGPAVIVSERMKLVPHGLDLQLSGPVQLTASREGVVIRAPSLSMRAVLPDAGIELPLLGKCPLDLDLRVDATCTDLTVEMSSLAVGGRIKVNYALHPTGLVAELLPQLSRIGGEIALELQPGGHGRLDAPLGFLEQAIAPLLEFVGPRPGAPIVRPAVKDTGAFELGERVYQVTTSVPHPGNDVRVIAEPSAVRATRLQLIRQARSTLVLQAATLTPNDDADLVDALATAVQAGVTVRVLVDGIASLRNVTDLTAENPTYRRLRDAGVQVGIFNDPRASGLGRLLEEVSVVPELAGDSYEDLRQLRDPFTAVTVFARLCGVATGTDDSVPADVRDQVAQGLARLLLSSRSFREVVKPEQAKVPLGLLNQVIYAARQVVALSYRMTEPILVADACVAFTGSPGTTRESLDLEAHLVISGPGAVDLHNHFIETWNQVTGECHPPHRGPAAEPDKPVVQIVSHQPRTEAGHRIAATMTEAVRATAPGQRISIINPSFLPTGSLVGFKDALCDAARRGVVVGILSNSAATTDSPGLIAAAVFTWRELLAAGCRIYASKLRRIRAHAAVFGDGCAMVGSWTCDNRSEVLTSELVAIAYDSSTIAALESLFEANTAAGAAEEIRLDSIASQNLGVELRSGWRASLGLVR